MIELPKILKLKARSLIISIICISFLLVTEFCVTVVHADALFQGQIDTAGNNYSYALYNMIEDVSGPTYPTYKQIYGTISNLSFGSTNSWLEVGYISDPAVDYAMSQGNPSEMFNQSASVVFWSDTDGNIWVGLSDHETAAGFGMPEINTSMNLGNVSQVSFAAAFGDNGISFYWKVPGSHWLHSNSGYDNIDWRLYKLGIIPTIEHK
jgi:hypothetical protein